MLIEHLEEMIPEGIGADCVVLPTKREAQAMAYRAGPADGTFTYRPVRVDGGWAVAVTDDVGAWVGYL